MVKNLPASIPQLERPPGEGNGNALHYSCLGNPMNRRAWRAIVYRLAKSQRESTSSHESHTLSS